MSKISIILIGLAIIALAYSFYLWNRRIDSEEIQPTYQTSEQNPSNPNNYSPKYKIPPTNESGNKPNAKM